MSRFRDAALGVVAALLLAGTQAVAQDVAAGEKLFKRCSACHAVGEGAKNKVGPELNELFGREAGGLEDYRYSAAMTKAGEGGLVWNEETLAQYLADPKGFVKGTKMAFPGFKKEEDLANITAYLKTFSTGAQGQAEPAAESAKETEKAAEVAPADGAPAEKADGPAGVAETAKAASGTPAQDAGLVLGLGRVATDAEIAAWDIDIRPDGAGLPKGSGTVARGMGIYDEQCASCHGDFGEAIGRWPVLAGGQGTLTNERPEKTIGSYWPYLSTVYDYVRRAMPFGNARLLSDDDVYALTAYLLYLNDVVADEDFELSDENFASVKLPNEANFIADDRFEEAHYARDREPCMKDCLPSEAKITMHAAVLDVTPEDSENDDAPAAGID